MNRLKIRKQLMPYIFLFILIAGVLVMSSLGKYKTHDLTYDKFITHLNKEKVEELEIVPKNAAGVYIIKGKLKSYSEYESFKLNTPISEVIMEQIIAGAEKNKVKIETTPNPEASSLLNVVINVVPMLLMVGATFWIFSKISGSNKNNMDFGRSKAKLVDDKDKIKFTEVAGLVEEKEEVSELIDFLRNPKKFRKLGARIPKGVLLVGPPGTGKTLLAKAVAGEADVPFYYISGSDFVELFVGVGASRVRDMFKQAKQTAPCLIFIDEIDAVGRERGAGLGGGHDEREQTLNQLLTEMDGFGANEGIIIIAATNRPDVLDPALLRPGRFDRQVTVSLPDQKERKAILDVHAKGKIFGDDVNLTNISKRTPGFSGADLENLLNEAALLAVRRNKKEINMEEIDEASDRVRMGPAKTSRTISDKEKRLVSIHESGHAVVGIKHREASEVHKISIIPRGMAGGFVLSLPKEETSIQTKKDLFGNIVGLLGGRVAEELYLDEVSTGASHDFKVATRIARAMVTEFGMSSLGPVQFEEDSGNVFMGRDFNKSRNFSDKVAFEIDTEVRKIMDEAYKIATDILKKEKDLVMLLADTLMEKETLTKEEITELVETGKLESLEQEKKENQESNEQSETKEKANKK